MLGKHEGGEGSGRGSYRLPRIFGLVPVFFRAGLLGRKEEGMEALS